MSTYWNGEPTPARRVRVIVGDSPLSTWWCADLIGTERQAVEVTYSGRTFFIDDADGQGWAKVTEGCGSPRWAHRGLPGTSKVIPRPGDAE